MSKTYKIVKIQGLTEDLFRMVGPFAMDRKVIRELDGYPILADENMTWFIAIKDNEVVSFAAIKQLSGGTVEFTNSYTTPEFRGNGIHRKLFNERLKWCMRNKVKVITATCREASLAIFMENGFNVLKEFKTWTKVQKWL